MTYLEREATVDDDYHHRLYIQNSWLARGLTFICILGNYGLKIDITSIVSGFQAA